MASLTKKVAGCDFGHFNLQDSEDGIHPFGAARPSPQSGTIKLQRALLICNDALCEGAGASLPDFQVLHDAGAPRSMAEGTCLPC